MVPQRPIVQAMGTDNHRGRCLGALRGSAPLRDQPAVTGEHDRLGRLRRELRRDLSATAEVECLGDELSCDGHCAVFWSLVALATSVGGKDFRGRQRSWFVTRG
jgi:hypothetical protein